MFTVSSIHADTGMRSFEVEGNPPAEFPEYIVDKWGLSRRDINPNDFYLLYDGKTSRVCGGEVRDAGLLTPTNIWLTPGTSKGSSPRNQCPNCKRVFISETGYDKHRTGEYGATTSPRRCLTSDEMQGKGMVLRGDGAWITKASTWHTTGDDE